MKSGGAFSRCEATCDAQKKNPHWKARVLSGGNNDQEKAEGLSLTNNQTLAGHFGWLGQAHEREDRRREIR
jgi:hypothetical protein